MFNYDEEEEIYLSLKAKAEYEAAQQAEYEAAQQAEYEAAQQAEYESSTHFENK